jgi:hypothetical protein
MPWEWMPMKDVIHCVKFGSGVCNRYESKISEWGNPVGVMPYTNWCSSQVIGDRLKWNISVSRGKETDMLIPLVAASEGGICLKLMLACWLDWQSDVAIHWIWLRINARLGDKRREGCGSICSKLTIWDLVQKCIMIVKLPGKVNQRRW